MAVGPTCQPTKNKNKEEKNIFYGTTGAKIFFHKLKYLIFTKLFNLHNTFT
jgi:hypothetical protein